MKVQKVFCLHSSSLIAVMAAFSILAECNLMEVKRTLTSPKLLWYLLLELNHWSEWSLDHSCNLLGLKTGRSFLKQTMTDNILRFVKKGLFKLLQPIRHCFNILKELLFYDIILSFNLFTILLKKTTYIYIIYIYIYIYIIYIYIYIYKALASLFFTKYKPQ